MMFSCVTCWWITPLHVSFTHPFSATNNYHAVWSSGLQVTIKNFPDLMEGENRNVRTEGRLKEKKKKTSRLSYTLTVIPESIHASMASMCLVSIIMQSVWGTIVTVLSLLPALYLFVQEMESYCAMNSITSYIC